MHRRRRAPAFAEFTQRVPAHLAENNRLGGGGRLGVGNVANRQGRGVLRGGDPRLTRLASSPVKGRALAPLKGSRFRKSVYQIPGTQVRFRENRAAP